MIQKKPKIVEINDTTISRGLGAPIVDVIIDGIWILGFQDDAWSNVNLMSMETLYRLGITTMVCTSIIQRMASHICTNPLGELPKHQQ